MLGLKLIHVSKRSLRPHLNTMEVKKYGGHFWMEFSNVLPSNKSLRASKTSLKFVHQSPFIFHRRYRKQRYGETGQIRMWYSITHQVAIILKKRGTYGTMDIGFATSTPDQMPHSYVRNLLPSPSFDHVPAWMWYALPIYVIQIVWSALEPPHYQKTHIVTASFWGAGLKDKLHKVPSRDCFIYLTQWRHILIWSTLSQVMACCLMTPSHCLNQCWPIPLMGSCGIYPWVVSWEVFMASIYKMSLKIPLLKLLPNRP